MKKIPFVFLTHINRTGSTYIASLLDKYEEIDVGIEGIIPDNYIKPMPIINSNEALNQYLAILYSDKRFIDWEIDPERLRAELLKIEFPISFNQILQTLFNIYFKNNTQTSLYVHKSGPYINYYSELKTDFPDSKFIFPVRDPRAVYNSMLNSKTIDGAYMARNPINTVAEIKKNYNLAIKLNHNNDFYIVVYESLINLSLIHI